MLLFSKIKNTHLGKIFALVALTSNSNFTRGKGYEIDFCSNKHCRRKEIIKAISKPSLLKQRRQINKENASV